MSLHLSTQRKGLDAYLSHENLAEGLKVLAQFLLSGLPGKAEHNQVRASLLALHALGLRHGALQVVIALAFIF